MKSQFFGDKALSGFVKQKVRLDGDLEYKGVIHLFGSKYPIYLTIEPCDKFVNGEKVYKVLTAFVPLEKDGLTGWMQVAKRINLKRLEAIRHLREMMLKLGAIYEYQKYRIKDREKEQKIQCKHCQRARKKELNKLLHAATRSAEERQRQIYKRKIRELSSKGKGNKRKHNEYYLGG